jgi:group II intron reverse transcriptase/maturase
VQHAAKGVYWACQQALGSAPSYCRYAYSRKDWWENVPSFEGWTTTRTTALESPGRILSKRAAVAPTTNSRKNLYAKSTGTSWRLLGGNVLQNLGSPKGSNSYGDRVLVVARNISSEGGQPKTTKKEDIAAISGLNLLKVIAGGENDIVQNVYRIVYDVEVLKTSYNKLKSRPASTTPGIDGKDLNTLEINEKYFNELSNKLRTEKYRPAPVKRVLIPKPGNKTRPLGIPSIEDRIVQQSLLYLLEAVFEKTFSDKSHGFRPKKGAHTACKNIRQWRGVSWFIEGDIISYFDTINQKKLTKLVSKRIQDQQVIDLLWKFLRAGVVTDGKYKRTIIGVPQGAVISPILSNIYLHELDLYVETLRKKYDTKKTSEPNPVYRKAKSRLQTKKGKEKKEGYKQLRKLKSTIRVGMRLYYARYADDWLIGIWGKREDAVKVKNKIENFLREKLELEMSLEKTKITHAGKEKAVFLGYDIYSPTPKESFFEKGKISKVKKRASHVSIYIDAPYHRIKERLIEEKILEVKNGKWLINAVTHWINYNHAEILYRYNWIIKGYLNYYSHVNNLHIFHKIINLILLHSCALTLGRKLKLRSRKKVFRQFGKTLKDPKSNSRLCIPQNYQSNTKDYRIDHKNDPLKVLKWSVRTQHLLEGPCVGCGATTNIQIHHVKKLANIKREKGSIQRIMATLGRKQVPVCIKCHKDIHTGKYDNENSPRKKK